MKSHPKILSLLAFFYAVILLSTCAFAQVQVKTENFSDKSLLIHYPGQTMDADTIIYSSDFTLAKYDADKDSLIFSYQKSLSSVIGTPSVSSSLWGTFDGVSYDSLIALGAVSDNVETYHEGRVSYKGVVRYPFYRIKNSSGVSQAADTQIELWLYFYKPD